MVILDGWGIGKDDSRSAIAQGRTPFYDSLLDQYPNSQLLTHGKNVGLPDGQMGNSEVGHLNIGAGRVVYQDLVKISKTIEEQRLGNVEKLKTFIERAKISGNSVHLMGLLSDGGVHSHIDHLFGFIDYLVSEGLKRIVIHAFLDGRDTPPMEGKNYLQRLLDHIEDKPVVLASVVGRYYAMDRDNRWERIKVAYDLLVNGKGTPTMDFVESVQAQYEKHITDEFMIPLSLDRKDDCLLKENDHVLFFNYRADRPRQLTDVLTQKERIEFELKPLPLDFVTMTEYDKTFKGIDVLFDKQVLTQTLGETISEMGLTQLRAAETEKYPHVTYFFNGGKEAVFEGEERLLVNSPKVATYDSQPEMSAVELTEKAMTMLESQRPDFVALNFANADMVGHTGVFSAAIKAVEAVDAAMRKLSKKALELGYQLIVIADHGNSDYMINDDGSAHTAHTTNPVPCIWIGKGLEEKNLRNGILADVAPTILEIMGLDQPELMTGKSLIDS